MKAGIILQGIGRPGRNSVNFASRFVQLKLMKKRFIEPEVPFETTEQEIPRYYLPIGRSIP